MKTKLMQDAEMEPMMRLWTEKISLVKRRHAKHRCAYHALARHHCRTDELMSSPTDRTGSGVSTVSEDVQSGPTRGEFRTTSAR